MALLNFTAAARAIGVNRSTIARALKSGRLSATTNEAGERCIDTVELLRVFGSLQADAQADAQPLPMRAMGTDALVDVLQEQLRCANERERQGREREARLLALLEAEQQARRALEQRLLPALKPPLPRYTRPVALLIVLALALLVLAITRWAS